MKHIITIYNVFILSFLIILQSCIGMKPDAMRSGKKLFTTFFVGEDGTQYFIKPILLTNNDGSELIVDITFRYKNQIKDSAIFSFSIYDNVMYKELDNIILNSNNEIINIENINFLFVEKYGKKYKSRYTFKTSMQDLTNLFKNENWNFEINNIGINKKFTATYRTCKKLRELNDIVFSLF